MIVLRMEDGFAVLHGRNENEWVIAPYWPCSGQAIRKVAASRMPKAFVDEAAAFADEKFLEQEA
jgi:hypothetical protein